eukprot:10044629-Heterocapsa_arctica.AAC.1
MDPQLGEFWTDAPSTTPVATRRLVDTTTCIRRVVRPTMAAEPASRSMAIDQQLYARLLWQHMLYGQSP